MRHFLLILLYVGTGTLGLYIGAEGGFATPVWYPSGIAMGLLILWGLQYAPSVAVAAFLTNFLHGASPIMAAMIALGNMAEALCGAWVLRRRQHHVAPLEDIGRIAELVVVTAIASTIISAINGTFTLWVHDVIATTDIVRVFKTWWLGDALGILLGTPLILVWRRPRLSTPERALWKELLVILLLLGAVSCVFYLPPLQGILLPTTYPYFLYPILIWMALQFEIRGTTLIIFVLSLLALWASVHGVGPFASRNPIVAGTNVQMFFGLASVTSLIMASVVRQRRKAAAVKDTFMNMISHELRTPLATVKTNLENLRTGVGGRLSDTQQLSVTIANRNIDRLARIIANILDFSRLESGKALLNCRAVNLNTLITELLLSVKPVLDEQHLTMTYHPPATTPNMLADPDLVQQVVWNLVDNAIRFAKQRIQIRVVTQTGMLQLSVIDDGEGIPAEKIGLLFKKFQQINREVGGGYKGTGLGLVICKEIITLHGGTIWVESPPDRGCQFHCRLPIHGPRHNKEAS